MIVRTYVTAYFFLRIFDTEQCVQKCGDEGEYRHVFGRRLLGHLGKAEAHPCVHFGQGEGSPEAEHIDRPTVQA